MTPFLAVMMATALFFALVVLGFGALTFFTGTPPIAVSGVSVAPPVLAMIAAVAVFAGVLWRIVRPRYPVLSRMWLVVWATPLVHLAVLWVTVYFSVPGFTSGRGFFLATQVAAGMVTGGFSVVIFVAALLTAASAVAVRRAGPGQARWGWERQDDEDE